MMQASHENLHKKLKNIYGSSKQELNKANIENFVLEFDL